MSFPGSSREGKEPYSRFHSIGCGATLRLFQALNVKKNKKWSQIQNFPRGPLSSAILVAM